MLKFLSPLFSIFHGFFSNRNDLNPDNFPKKKVENNLFQEVVHGFLSKPFGQESVGLPQ